MALDAKLGRLTLRKLDRELSRLAKKQAPEHVHKFRTHSRRVEALLLEGIPELHRNDEKLLKLLARLRKKAGRVRDLDVQIACLRNLKIPQGNGHKAQFMDALVQERTQRENKFSKALDRETVNEIRKRLRRSLHDLEIPGKSDPLARTLSKLAGLRRSHSALTERTLHQYRIIGKRARYLAELAVDGPRTHFLVDELKHMQDVIGDWHDWLKLTQKAEALLGDVRDSSLVALLRNVTQAKFRQSLDAVSDLRGKLAGFAARPVASESRKSPASETATESAA